jgi:glutamate dehydrogenase (NAD(P)+)
VAITDISGGLHNPNGLHIKDVYQFIRADRHNVLKDYPRDEADFISNDELFEVDCDVIIPAAREDQIHEGNADKIKASLVVEGANGPTTHEGDDILQDRNIMVIPDILANAGGVTVSYFEWVQDLQNFFWDEVEIMRQLRRILLKAYDKVATTSEENGVSMRMAANIHSIQTVADATITRGIYP